MSGEARSATPSRKPYFLRAMHAWMGDAGLTPQLIVNARGEGVQVPPGYADEQGRVVLNIGMEAVRDLTLENAAVSFGARFGGVACAIYLPMAAILAIYARETGEGIAFEAEKSAASEPEPKPQAKPADAKPTLRIVK